MALKLLYHESALADLEEVFGWSRENYPERTEQFGDELFNRLDLLTEFPHLGTPVKEQPNVRRLLHAPFYVYYRLDEIRGALEILHIWHTSRRSAPL